MEDISGCLPFFKTSWDQLYLESVVFEWTVWSTHHNQVLYFIFRVNFVNQLEKLRKLIIDSFLIHLLFHLFFVKLFCFPFFSLFWLLFPFCIFLALSWRTFFLVIIFLILIFTLVILCSLLFNLFLTLFSFSLRLLYLLFAFWTLLLLWTFFLEKENFIWVKFLSHCISFFRPNVFLNTFLFILILAFPIFPFDFLNNLLLLPVFHLTSLNYEKFTPSIFMMIYLYSSSCSSKYFSSFFSFLLFLIFCLGWPCSSTLLCFLVYFCVFFWFFPFCS